MSRSLEAPALVTNSLAGSLVDFATQGEVVNAESDSERCSVARERERGKEMMIESERSFNAEVVYGFNSASFIPISISMA